MPIAAARRPSHGATGPAQPTLARSARTGSLQWNPSLLQGKSAAAPRGRVGTLGGVCQSQAVPVSGLVTIFWRSLAASGVGLSNMSFSSGLMRVLGFLSQTWYCPETQR